MTKKVNYFSKPVLLVFYCVIYAIRITTMIKPNNPFLIAGYHSPEYFCDRETECILNALHNERNLTLVAPRRMGKQD